MPTSISIMPQNFVPTVFQFSFDRSLSGMCLAFFMRLRKYTDIDFLVLHDKDQYTFFKDQFILYSDFPTIQNIVTK